jgi:small-conductance mechanosensitive channel
MSNINLNRNTLIELGNKISEILTKSNVKDSSVLHIKVDENSFKKIDEDLYYRNDEKKEDFLPSENEIILKDPEPFIKVYEYADSSIKLLCRVWTKSTDYFSIFFDLLDYIKEEFDKNNIHIPYPKLDVNIYNKD